MTRHLFVYGTLRRGVRNSMSHLLGDEARFVGDARARGRLLSLGEYPGYVPCDDPDSWVRGEVYALDRPPETLARLDEYEECAPHSPRPHAFERVEIDVSLESGTKRAWIYVFRGSTADRPVIASGDFAAEQPR